MSIKYITLSGTPEEIGYEHGRLLTDLIHNNIDFYRSLFLNFLGDETKILEAAERFKESIQAYNPNFATEINHIALGAGVQEPLWLYAINSRTELSMLAGRSECTAIVWPSENLLAQTWDWAKKLAGNFVIMRISLPNGHKILQLTEAGIIGKIGLNNQGLGVTLNFLYDEVIEFSSVPIHIVLRQILECSSLEEAINAAHRSKTGKASNLIISQAGSAVDVEFAGDCLKIENIQGESYIHTNHFLHAKPPVITNKESYKNSSLRYETAKSLLTIANNQSTDHFRKILSDQSNGKDAILASYKPDPEEMLGEYGTLATIIMDLETKTMQVRAGNPKDDFFSITSFEEYRFS